MKTASSPGGFLATLGPATTPDSSTNTAPQPDSDPGSFTDVLQQQVAAQPAASSTPPFADFTGLASSSSASPDSDPTTAAKNLSPASLATAVPANVVAAPAALSATPTPLESPTNPKSGFGHGGHVKKGDPGNLSAQENAKAASSNGPALPQSPSAYVGSSGVLVRQALLAALSQPTPAKGETSAVESENSPAVADSELQASVQILDDKVSTLKIAGRLGGLLGLEKKSGVPRGNGIFLPSTDTASNSNSTPLPLNSALAGLGQLLASQPVASSEPGSSVSESDLDAAASGITGTANGKKAEMNATLDLPDIDLGLTSNSAAAASPDLDIHVVLGTNHDFQEALQQVMHVAEHSGLSPLTPPLRIAIEIQTPPGAVVNVYISRQHDQYRAQLSASDPQALSWVQDQIGVLRETTDTDVAVRWLPAQLEPASTSALDQKCSFTWGDQSQQGRNQNSQLADDRQQSRQRKPGWSGRVAAAVGDDFSSTLGALGRAA